jgi:hypothetical protein
MHRKPLRPMSEGSSGTITNYAPREVSCLVRGRPGALVETLVVSLHEGTVAWERRSLEKPC